jgi:hypothetical protein
VNGEVMEGKWLKMMRVCWWGRRIMCVLAGMATLVVAVTKSTPFFLPGCLPGAISYAGDVLLSQQQYVACLTAISGNFAFAPFPA